MSDAQVAKESTPPDGTPSPSTLSTFSNPVLDAIERRRPENLAEALAALDNCMRIARRAEREFAEFVYVVTHDLKGPLRSVLSYAEFLAEDLAGQLSDDACLYIDRLRVNAGQASDQLMSLLELSRVGRWRYPWEMVDLTATVRAVAARFDTRLCEQNIVCDIEDGLPHVFAERVRIEQMFEVLIENALRFRQRRGGFVRIFAGQPEAPDETAVVHIADDGFGIPEDRLETIFNVFKRLHPKEFSGVGMGLTLARRIMDYHGGRIWATSRQGEGTTIHLAFRRENPETTEEG